MQEAHDGTHNRSHVDMDSCKCICVFTNRCAGIFCAVFVPTVNAVMGKKYAIRLAVVGVVWLVISIMMYM